MRDMRIVKNDVRLLKFCQKGNFNSYQLFYIKVDVIMIYLHEFIHLNQIIKDFSVLSANFDCKIRLIRQIQNFEVLI